MIYNNNNNNGNECFREETKMLSCDEPGKCEVTRELPGISAWKFDLKTIDHHKLVFTL